MTKIKLLLFFSILLFLYAHPVNAKMLDNSFERPIIFNNGSSLNSISTIDEKLTNKLKPINFSIAKPEIDVVNSEAVFYDINNKKYPNGAYGISSTNGNYYDLWYTNFYRELFKIRNQSYDVKVSVLRVFDEAPGMLFINPNNISFSVDDPSFNNSNTSSRYHGFELIVNIFKSNTTTGAVIPGLYLGVNNLNNIAGTNEGVKVSYLEPTNKFLMPKTNNNYMYGNDTFYTLDNGDTFNNSIYLTSYDIQNGGNLYITYATNRGSDDISFDFLLKSFKVNYKYEINNNITDYSSEDVYENDYPKGINIDNEKGLFINWTCDKDVIINDKTILSGNPISNEELKQITVKDDLVFTAHYKVKKYKIRTSVQNGNIDSSVEVNINDNKSISYVPKEGYHLDSITIDGRDVNIDKYPNFYTFENISSDHEISVVFSINKYKIKTSVEGGYIDSEKEVSFGDNTTISYHPNEGYKLYKVLVDNTSVNNLREYDFINVKENHTIHVIYEKIPNIEVNKTSDKKDYKNGEIITYNIKLNQTVDEAVARDVIVTDTLNKNLVLDEDSLNKNNNIQIIEVSSTHFRAKINEIKTNTTISYKAKIKENITESEINNDVIVKIGNLEDTFLANNKIFIPKGRIENKINNNTYYYDDIITYEIKASQKTKGATIHNALIKQTLPTELELINASSNNGVVKTNSNSLTCLVKELSNEEVKIRVTARVKTKIGKVRIISSLVGDEIIYPIEDYFFINIKSPKLYITSTSSINKAKINNNIIFYVDILSKKAKEVTLDVFIPKGLKLNKSSIKTDGNIKINNNKFTVFYKSLDTKKRIEYKAKVIDTGTLKTIYTLDSINNTNDSVNSYNIVKAKNNFNLFNKKKRFSINKDDINTIIPMTGANANNMDLYLIAVLNLVLVSIIIIIIKTKKNMK